MLLLAGALSVASGRIDARGAATGVLVGFFIFMGGGFVHLGLLLVFFVAGSAASRWKLRQKEDLLLAEARHAKRSVANVLANGGVAGLCGLLAWLLPDQETIWQIMLACSLAAACADTLSSELGNIYGRRFVNILSFKPDVRGRDGVISLEGTLWGVAGALLIAMAALPAHNHVKLFAIILFAGILGNIADSVLGASLQRNGYLNNHTVNFANTAIAAGLGAVLFVTLPA
jgi:uncharacterized protein (TIGR00297 family)